MARQDVKVLVSGASIAGLTTAYWLCHYGFKVTVVETAPGVRPGGQPVDVRGPAIEVAEKMGILAAVRDRSTKLTGMSVVDSEGREIFRSTERTLTGGHFDSPDVEILRDELCYILHDAVGGRADFIFGNAIAALRQDAAGVDVDFANGQRDRFDVVIGADGLHSAVRRLVFGPESEFLHYMGMYISVFAIPNFLGLERWQIFHEHKGVLGGVVAFEKETKLRCYISFKSEQPVDYDYRDVAAQKQMIVERAAEVGWEFPRIVQYMQETPDFHFDSASLICTDSWSRGRITLVGDAGYCASPLVGQGTTNAMMGAYVLAGELATHTDDLAAGIAAYEQALRVYVTHSQDLARQTKDASFVPSESGETADTGDDASEVPDFGQMVAPFTFKDYVRLSAQ